MFGLAKFFLSAGGLGFLPKMPGTYGSLGGIALALMVPSLWLGFVTFSLLLISILVAHYLMMHRKINQSDPGWIVIDEVVGQMIPLIVVGTSSWGLIVLSFILFRFFDITKIGLTGVVERYCEQKRETWALGVMMDDVIAGGYAAIIVYIIQRVF
jgi:phosphatidylglycerophosphatase A